MPHSTILADGVSATDATLRLPRILCLHGGGTNSRIFRAQCRIIRRRLEDSFRLVFPDAPYVGEPGPDVTSVYAGWGPFRNWMKAQPGATNNLISSVSRPVNGVLLGVHENDATAVVDAIDKSLAQAMTQDDEAGATGEWCGLLGFSQGAKIAASLLLREQDRMDFVERTYQGISRPSRGPMFRFAVLLAGRGPLITLDPDLRTFFGREEEVQEAALRLPTVHVHGLQDEGLAMHRDLRNRCCTKDSTTLVEWDGNHRVPIKVRDVDAVVAALMSVYQQPRVL